MRKTCIISILFILSILLINTIVKDTYSKYASSAELDISGNTGAWTIKINEQDITNNEGSVQTFTIQELNYSSSTYVAPNKIAPGLSGNFEINFDATGTDVAAKFDITLDLTNIEETGRINLKSVKKFINGTVEENGIIQTGENTYTGIISLNDIQSENEISVQVELEWPNDVTGANDIVDSEIGTDLSLTSISIPVTVDVTQYLGETIPEFSGV